MGFKGLNIAVWNSSYLLTYTLLSRYIQLQLTNQSNYAAKFYLLAKQVSRDFAPHPMSQGDAVALLLEYRTCDVQVAGSSPGWTPLRTGLGQATYTCVPLSQSSIAIAFTPNSPKRQTKIIKNFVSRTVLLILCLHCNRLLLFVNSQ